MARILLVAATTGYQTRSFCAAARGLGVDVLLATDRCHILDDPWGDSAIPVRFEDPEAAAQDLSSHRVHGIVAVSDRPTLIAALTARLQGLPWHSPSAVAVCRDKHSTRLTLEQAGLAVPRHFRVPLNSSAATAAASSTYPCVLKPLGLSASRGVIRANNPAEFKAAFDRIRCILQQPDLMHLHDDLNLFIQIEEYIEGREFAVEGLMTNGEFTVLAIFDKPDPLEGPFFEETIYVTPSRESPEVQSAIIGTTTRALHALGLSHGPIHAEMRVNSAGVFMLEVAPRPIGGLCARALRFGSSEPHAAGLNLEQLVILHALGEMPANLKLSPAALGVMMVPVPRAGIYDATSGVEAALSKNHIDDVVITAKKGQRLIPLPEGASYCGFIFASAEDPVSVESALREAHRCLEFATLPALEVIS